MAANVKVTEGLGKVIAADDVAGVMYQRVKLATGADGVAVDVSSSNPVPVTISSAALPAGAATEATLLAELVKHTATTATVSSVTSSASPQQFYNIVSGRKGLIFMNTDANACLVKYGSGVSATSYTVRIVSGGYWEMPLPIYTGRIDVLWEAAGTGVLIGTELT